MSEDLHSGCTPLTEARGLHRLLSTGFTIEQIRALIAVPQRIECVLRSYAQENTHEAYWIEGCIKFRQAVAREFERLVRNGAPIADVREAAGASTFTGAPLPGAIPIGNQSWISPGVRPYDGPDRRDHRLSRSSNTSSSTAHSESLLPFLFCEVVLKRESLR